MGEGEPSTYICLSTSSALVCCVKLFARTARRIFAALSSGSLAGKNPPVLLLKKAGRSREGEVVLRIRFVGYLCARP
jgi:hypothetical protein